MGRIKTAVLGAGLYGAVHARVYHKDPRTELACIWGRTEQRARALAEKYGCRSTTSLDSIVQDKEIGVVSIATPDFAHAEPAIRLLEAGKHVLIEKPMATSTAECRRIMEAREKGGGKLMVNFHNRWHPPIFEAKRRIDAGEIGVPVSMRLVLSDRIEVATRWLSWAGRSGPEWFLFPHTVDLAAWLLNGEMPRRIFAVGRKGVLSARGIDAFDVVQAELEFEHCAVSLESGWILPPGWRNIVEFSVEVLGTKGRLEIAGDAEGLSVASDVYHTPFVLDFITEEDPIRYFVDCVERDITPVPGARDGLAVTTIIEGIVRSMKEGRSLEHREDCYA